MDRALRLLEVTTSSTKQGQLLRTSASSFLSYKANDRQLHRFIGTHEIIWSLKQVLSARCMRCILQVSRLSYDMITLKSGLWLAYFRFVLDAHVFNAQ